MNIEGDTHLIQGLIKAVQTPFFVSLHNISSGWLKKPKTRGGRTNLHPILRSKTDLGRDRSALIALLKVQP